MKLFRCDQCAVVVAVERLESALCRVVYYRGCNEPEQCGGIYHPLEEVRLVAHA